jgi:hypothetical protein
MTTPSYQQPRKNHYSFQKDHPIAERCEQAVATRLEALFEVKLLSRNNDNRYDLLFECPDGTHLTVEVKQDFSCERTGNVGVEYECRGKPSGIAVSQATHYAYVVHRPDGECHLYMAPTKVLKKLIEEKRYFRTVTGGDPGSNSKNYLFKLDVFTRSFTDLGAIRTN